MFVCLDEYTQPLANKFVVNEIAFGKILQFNGHGLVKSKSTARVVYRTSKHLSDDEKKKAPHDCIIATLAFKNNRKLQHHKARTMLKYCCWYCLCFATVYVSLNSYFSVMFF